MQRLLFVMMLAAPLAAIAGGCRHAVYPPANPIDPVKVYLADYGWHSGVLLPIPGAGGRFADDGDYVEFVFGDFDYMSRNKDGVIDGVGAILWSRQAGLGRRVIPIRRGAVPRGVKAPPLSLTGFHAAAPDVCRLTARLESRYARHAATARYNRFDDTTYVKDDERYRLGNNCSHAARRWLTALGCDVRGSLLTFGFDVATNPSAERKKARERGGTAASSSRRLRRKPLYRAFVDKRTADFSEMKLTRARRRQAVSRHPARDFALDSPPGGAKMIPVEYTVIIEPADDGTFSVYVPDLPGCVSTGTTRDDAIESIREAIAGHVQTLRDLGEPVSPPRSQSHVVAA